MVTESPGVNRLEAMGVRGEALAGTAARLLGRARGFVSAGRAGARDRRYLGQLHVHRAELVAGGGGVTTAQVVVTLELTPVMGDVALRETSRGSAPVTAGPDGFRAALEAAATGALQRAVDGFAMQLAADGKRNADLVKDLASSEPRVRDQAMRVLAERGDRDAVPALVAKLRDPDPEVAERAVGALAQLRDPRAVGPLIGLVHRRDPGYVANMARIIGDIGGADARAWLLTMASGHPDVRVRSAAHEALADLAAREPHARAETGPR